MAQQNEDPAGMNRGAKNEHSAHSNGGTHTNGNWGAQDQPKGATTSRGARKSWRQFTFTSKELKARTFPPIAFIVPGLIPAEGVTLICAKPKVGKSWLLLDTCLSATEQGDVLYLALEDGPRRLQSRTAKLLTFCSEWPENLTLATKWRRIDRGGLDDMREWVESTRSAGRKVAFIAIDVLQMV
jgi:predicted ATP-dependent serine protease